jgi:hypothetical protein
MQILVQVDAEPVVVVPFAVCPRHDPAIKEDRERLQVRAVSVSRPLNEMTEPDPSCVPRWTDISEVPPHRPTSASNRCTFSSSSRSSASISSTGLGGS